MVAGKPHRPMVDLIRQRCGGFDPARTVVVGDRPSTDGRFAAEAGCRFAFVRSGVFGPGVSPDAAVATAWDVADLAAFADALDA